jgi:hypothetical protein
MPIKIDNPAKALATSILVHAIKERKKPAKRQEVNDFFADDWFEDVCDLAMVNPDVVRQKLGVVAKRRRTTACTGLAPTAAQADKGSTGASQ